MLNSPDPLHPLQPIRPATPVTISKRARHPSLSLSLNLSLGLMLSGVMTILLGSCGLNGDPVQAQGLPGLNPQETGKLDNTPPHLSALMTPTTLREDGFAFFFLNSNDDVAVTFTSIDIGGKAFVRDPSQYNSYGRYFTRKDNGTYQVRIAVQDAAGNIAEVFDEIKVDIPNKP